MKLAYVTVARRGAGTAHETYVQQLCEELTRAGHAVTLFAPVRWGAPGAAATRRVCDEVDVPCYPPARARYYVLAARLFSHRLRLRSHDVVLTHNYIAAIGLRMMGVPFCLDVHGTTTTALGRRVVKWLTVGRQCLALVVVSEAQRKELAAIGVDPGKIHLLPNASGLTVSHVRAADAKRGLGLDPDVHHVVYVGSLADDRGIDQLIAAQSRMGKKWQLVLVGGQERDIARLRADAAARQSATEVVFAGMVDHAMVARFLSAADVLVATYTSRVRTLGVMSPMKLAEYMTTGRPIVAPEVPAVRSMLQDYALFFPYTLESTASLEAALSRAAEAEPSSLAIPTPRQARGVRYASILADAVR